MFIRRYRYQQAELLNGRTAMTAVAGILIPSVRDCAALTILGCCVTCAAGDLMALAHVTLQILTKAGVLNVPAWYAAGKVSADQSNIDWRESPSRPSCSATFGMPMQSGTCILVVHSVATLATLEVACEWHIVCSANSANSKHAHSPCRRTAVRAVCAVPLG